MRTSTLSKISILLLSLLLFASCEAVRNFLSRDLEEEDYSVGELYVDEYVSEVPYVPTPSAEDKAAGRVNSLGIERSAGDNEQLYDAIEAWMHNTATMRYYNRQNMKAIGISEEKVMEYTDKRELRTETEGSAPNPQDFSTEPIAPENLTTLVPLDVRLDSLMGR